jgi:hypothetical protein
MQSGRNEHSYGFLKASKNIIIYYGNSKFLKKCSIQVRFLVRSLDMFQSFNISNGNIFLGGFLVSNFKIKSLFGPKKS